VRAVEAVPKRGGVEEGQKGEGKKEREKIGRVSIVRDGVSESTFTLHVPAEVERNRKPEAPQDRPIVEEVERNARDWWEKRISLFTPEPGESRCTSGELGLPNDEAGNADDDADDQHGDVLRALPGLGYASGKREGEEDEDERSNELWETSVSGWKGETANTTYKNASDDIEFVEKLDRQFLPAETLVRRQVAVKLARWSSAALCEDERDDHEEGGEGVNTRPKSDSGAPSDTGSDGGEDVAWRRMGDRVMK
jgi:hypothetical protein